MGSINFLPLSGRSIFSSMRTGKLYIYGGTFDPVTDGHYSVVKRLLAERCCVFIAPTSQNPWKEREATDFETRRNMWLRVLKHEALVVSEEPSLETAVVSSFEYEFAYQLISFLRDNFPEWELCWVMGEDLAGTEKKWARWDEFNIPVRVMPITIDIHATEVREGSKSPHIALLELYENKR